ncbi:O-antigen ligase family protein [Falsiroseomonas sp. HC035]|uniref:O-antigen ligase family protein n=1 Tax=Falsiroseomonas sp. HC035 TaxID=3390999 RepID=UPI003D31AE3B
MPRDILLGLGLALSTATQFRVPGLPLGPGELFLSAWLVLATTAQLVGGRPAANQALGRLVTFWTILALALSVALVSGLARDLFQDVSGMLHDITAYLLMMAIGLMLMLELQDGRRRRGAIWIFVGLSTGIVIIQLLSGFGLNLVPGVDNWFYDRFRGWSENPNQLGFFVVVLTFMALHLAETAPSPTERVGGLACAAVAGLAGVLTRSDSYVVALLIGASAWVALTAFVWFRTLRSGLVLRGATVLFALLSIPLAAAAFAPFAAAALERIEDTSASLYNDNEQGETRLQLWIEALDRGYQSGLIGFGPGPQLTSKSYKRPPPEKFEAHNTFLDLFVQGGLVALAAFIWLVGSAALGAWRTRLAGMLALIGALTAFGLFHYVVRQPIFWFGVAACLLEANRLVAASGLRLLPLRTEVST